MKDLKSKGRAAAGALASLTMIASMSAVPALAVAPGDGADGNAAADPQAEVGENAAVAGAVKVARAEGVFSYDQEAVTPNETIRTMFQKAVRVVCGAGIAFASENPLDWQLTVSGAVNDAYTASVGDLAGDESVQQKMTCTCGGNPAGGRAVLSYEINEEALTASVGGSNQLWMTRTPANYFVRDVVEIVVSAEDEAPAVPGEADEHPNSPNAGVLTGAQE